MKKIDNMIYTGDNTLLWILLGVVILLLVYAAWMVFHKPKKEKKWTTPPAASVRLSLDWEEEKNGNY